MKKIIFLLVFALAVLTLAPRISADSEFFNKIIKVLVINEEPIPVDVQSMPGSNDVSYEYLYECNGHSDEIMTEVINSKADEGWEPIQQVMFKDSHQTPIACITYRRPVTE